MQKDLLPDFLHLFHCLSAAPDTLLRLLETFEHDPRRIRACGATELTDAGCSRALLQKLDVDNSDRVERDLAWATGPDRHLVCYDDPTYPELLRHIDDRPALLYVEGDPALLGQPQVAIVGARRCTPGGAANAADFAAALGAAGFTVTSGLAHGIDTAAHEGALGGGGQTIAVIGTGIDRIYPARNRKLAGRIREHGLILSEFPLGAAAAPYHFPRRNRLISGLSLATLVIEAAARSGSLITARLAAEQGRDVFALPGSIHNPMSRGCHRLLREGAMLAEHPDDVIEALAPGLSEQRSQASPPARTDSSGIDSEHRQLLDSIGYDPVTADTLVERSGLTIDKLSSMLLILELNDLIQSAPGGCYVRIQMRTP